MMDSNALMDPRQIYHMLLRRKWLVILPLILVTGAAYAGSIFIPPVYESSVVIWIGESVRLSRDLERMIGEFRDLVGGQQTRRGDVRDLHRQITSLPYLSQLIDRLKLNEDPELDVEARNMMAVQPDLTFKDAKTYLVAQALKKKIDIQFIGSSHLKITAQADQPILSQQMAEELGVVFIEEKAQEDMRRIFLSLDFSYEQLARYEKELIDKVTEKTELEKEMARWQGNDRLTSDANRNDLSSEVQRRNRELADLEVEERGLIAELEKLGSSDLRLIPSSRLTQTGEQLMELARSYQGLVQNYAWNDAAITTLNLRVIRVEDEMTLERDRLVDTQFSSLDRANRLRVSRLAGIRQRRDVLTTFVSSLDSGLAMLVEKSNSLPDLKAKLDLLDREVSAAQLLRDRFKAQRESFEISQAVIEESRYKLVEKARVPLAPVWPDLTIILAAGLAIGFAIGFGLIFVMEISDQSLNNVEETERILDLKVVGIVPRIKKSDSAPVQL